MIDPLPSLRLERYTIIVLASHVSTISKTVLLS